MIKTFNINLAGQIFNINEDAYEQMSAYFNSLRTFYAAEPDKDEIIRDIESRFAELFLAKGKNYIITKEDAVEVINMMGNPQDFDEEAQPENTEKTTQHSSSASTTNIKKRLYRDPDNGLLSGVCAGLSAYFGINDAIWLRLAFILFALIGIGSPILIYIILILIMPKAETSAQKLEMRGEPINLSNIEKKIKDEAENISSLTQKNGKGFLYSLVNIFVSLVGIFVKAIVVLIRAIGIIVLFFVTLALFALAVTFILLPFLAEPVAGKYFFNGSYETLWMSLGGIILFSALFVMSAIHLYKFVNRTDKPAFRKLIFPFIISILVGILLLNIGGNNIRKTLAEKKKINQTFPLNYSYPSDTLQLAMNPAIDDENSGDVHINGVVSLLEFVTENKNQLFPVTIEISPSTNDSFKIVKEYSANGRNAKEAIKNATSFTHTISQINNKLVIDPYIQFLGDSVKFRNQKLKIKVYVPEGKVIRWDKHTEEYIDVDKLDINWDNISNTPPPPPAPPAIPAAPKTVNRKIEIKTKNGSSKVSINIDSDDKDIDKAIKAINDEINDSIDTSWESRMHRQHYIFRMVNGELVPLD